MNTHRKPRFVITSRARARGRASGRVGLDWSREGCQFPAVNFTLRSRRGGSSDVYLDHARGARSWETRLGRTLIRPEPLKAKALALVRAVTHA
jgi:hypothetical protein